MFLTEDKKVTDWSPFYLDCIDGIVYYICSGRKQRQGRMRRKI